MTRFVMLLLVVFGLAACGGSDDTWDEMGSEGGTSGSNSIDRDFSASSPAQQLMILLTGGAGVRSSSPDPMVGKGIEESDSSPDPMPGKESCGFGCGGTRYR